MKLLITASFVASALALPAVRNVKQRATPITSQTQLNAAVAGATDDATAANILMNIVPALAPTSIAKEQAGIADMESANPSDIFQSGANILLAGLAGGDYATISQAYLTESSTMNTNLKEPTKPVYPKANSSDAPYDLTEQQLRQVIYIPPDFTYGKKPIALFLPGTASLAGQAFGPNYGKLFKQQNIADPVYVNFPGENLADIQVAAEYTAYAINYISGISNGAKVRSPNVFISPNVFPRNANKRKGEHGLLVCRLS